MLLREISGGSTADNADAAKQALVLATMELYAPVLRFAQFYSAPGNADAPRKADTTSGGTNRAIDDDYPENNVTPDFGSVTLAIFGDEVRTDRAHVRRGETIEQVRVRSIESFAKNLGKNLQYQIFNGNATTNALQMNGILTLATKSSQLISFGSVCNTSTTAVQLAYAIKNACLDISGGAEFIAMPQGVLSTLSANVTSLVTYAPNALGGFIPSIDGIPIVISGKDSQGNDTLPWSSGNNGKIVIGRFGEKADITLMTNIGLEVKNLGLVGVHYTDSVELDAGLTILDDNAVRIIKDITYA